MSKKHTERAGRIDIVPNHNTRLTIAWIDSKICKKVCRYVMDCIAAHPDIRYHIKFLIEFPLLLGFCVLYFVSRNGMKDENVMI